MSFAVVFLSILLGGIPSFARQAQIIQILHTNDLHSYWEHALEPDRGGYSRIKSIMDKLEAEGDAKGWVTIRLDAGDFCDGTVDYLAGQGLYSFQLMKLMNYDVIALGNHDYVTGLMPLIWYGQHEDTRLPLVAANFDTDQPVNVGVGKIINRGGLRIAVVGATTDDILYTWMAAPAKIAPPENFIDQWLGEQHADIRIALTHLGLYKDIDIVQNSHNIDLVVGGHSHHTLHRPWLKLNLDRHIVPILQAGYHGHYVGQAIIKLPVWGATNIVKYNLIPVTPDVPQDPVVEAKVQEGLSHVPDVFRADPNQVVAQADSTLYTYRMENAPLANFIADAIRDASGADAVFDIGALYGIGLPGGPVTVADIYNLQPHAFRFPGPGWRIFTAHVTGEHLKSIISLASWTGYSFLTSGIVARLDWLHRVQSMLVDGQPVQDDKVYTLATSEGAIEATSRISRFKKYLPPPYTDTNIEIRGALLAKAEKQGVFHATSTEKPRVTFPGSDKMLSNDMCGECVSN